jgi:peptidoglycan hydrolase FlgJ
MTSLTTNAVHSEGQGFDTLSPNGLGQVAQQFEAIFLRQMIASMRSPSLGDELFGSDASNQFRDMSDARLADSMAGQFGIAQLLEKQLAQ